MLLLQSKSANENKSFSSNWIKIVISMCIILNILTLCIKNKKKVSDRNKKNTFNTQRQLRNRGKWSRFP